MDQMGPLILGPPGSGTQTIFEKCPFKEKGKLSKLFRLFLWGLKGSDIPQDFVLQQDPAVYQTPRN